MLDAISGGVDLNGDFCDVGPPCPGDRRRVQRQDLGLSDQSFQLAAPDDLQFVQSPLARQTVLQVDQATSPHQAFLRHIRERREVPDLDCRLGLRAGGHCQEAFESRCLALHFVTDFVADLVRENAVTTGTYEYR